MVIRIVLSKMLTYNHVNKRFASTLDRSLNEVRSMINCGLNIVHKKISSTFHGPTGYEVVKDVDLSNKTWLVTGANSGIGLEMTRCATARGAAVLMACRNKYAASIAQNICQPNQTIRSYEINLASLKSVKKCSEEILRNEKKIDVVILNAGTFGLPWTLTEDRLETTFQVNYLSQFQLLMNIESVLASDARVVFVSSESHRHLNWSVQDQLLPTEELVSLPRDKYTSIKAYNTSKLCGLLALHYLRYRWMKTSKLVVAAHPGSFVKTRLCRNWWPYDALYTCMKPFSKNISQAASTPLYCATSPDVLGTTATYFKDCKRCEESELAKDSNLAFRIYDMSKEIIKDREQSLVIDTAVTEAPQQTKIDHDDLHPDYST